MDGGRIGGREKWRNGGGKDGGRGGGKDRWREEGDLKDGCRKEWKRMYFTHTVFDLISGLSAYVILGPKNRPN